MLEKLTSTLQNLSLLEQFSARCTHEYICKFPRSMNSREVEKNGHLERRERGADLGTILHAEITHLSTRENRLKEVTFPRGVGVTALVFHCTKITSLPPPAPLSLSHTHTLFVLFSKLLWCPELKRARAEAFLVAEAARQISSPFVLPLARWQPVNSV